MIFNEYPYRNLEDLNLDYILKKVKELFNSVSGLEAWKTEHEAEYNQLKQLYDDIVSGHFPPAMYNTLYQWTVENSASIINSLTKMVFFGLTDDGHFVAYIPDTWDDIIFGTSGLDTVVPDLDYGHLILSY